MGAIGLLALAVNLGVAGLLYRYRGADSQALSVWLCTRNDCIANIAVMLAGAGVWASATAWPDIAVAAIIAGLGLSSAVRVIRQALREMRDHGIPRGLPVELGNPLRPPCRAQDGALLGRPSRGLMAAVAGSAWAPIPK